MVVIRSEKDTPESTEVVVVGAGPTGLLLAGDLATAGVPVTVLERRTEESNLTRAFAVHARTLEELDARGVADEVIASGHRVEGLRAFGKVQIHLGDLPTRFPYVLITPQYNVERVLAARAVRAGAVIVRGARLESIAQDTEGVDASYSMGGLVRKIRGQYLVGADGHHSTVRQALGLDFPGESVVSSLMLADVLLAKEPSEQREGQYSNTAERCERGILPPAASASSGGPVLPAGRTAGQSRPAANRRDRRRQRRGSAA